MPFVNNLVQTAKYTLDVAANVTVIAIRRDRISEADILVNPREERSISNGTGRLIFWVHPQAGSAGGVFKLGQPGLNPVEIQFGEADVQFVFDVI